MKQIVPILIFSMSVLPGFGQWNPDPTENNAIVTVGNSSAAAKSEILAVPDALGNSWLIWEETRNPLGEALFAQRVNADGSLAFAVGGIVVCQGNGTRSNISAIPDLANGIIIVWTDDRDNTNNKDDIYAQRINALGNPVYTANGVPIVNTPATQNQARITLVNPLQFAVVWRDDRNALNLDLYANYVDIATGARIFPNDIEIVSQNNNQSNQQVFPDGTGGLVMVWTDGRVSNSLTKLYGQRLNLIGAKQWGDNGIIIYENATANTLSPQIVGNLAGSFAVTWSDTRASSTDANVFAQIINLNGVLTFPADGLTICNATNSQINSLVTFANTQFIVTWRDPRIATSNNDIYVQAFDASGIKWAANGVQLTSAAGNQPNSATAGFNLIPDLTGGATVIWDDAANGTSNLDVRAQKVNSAGAVQYMADGLAVATRTGSNQRIPGVAPDIAGNIYVFWADSRNSTNAEIYGSRIEVSGILPITHIGIGADLKEQVATIRWETSFEQNMARHAVERSNDGQKFLSIGFVEAQNKIENAYAYKDEAPLAGRSFYRIRSIDKDGINTFSKTVQVLNDGRAIQNVKVYPNPSNGEFNLQLSNVPAATYQMQVTNLEGRVISTQTIDLRESQRIMTIRIPNSQKGLYLIRLIGPDGKAAATEKIFRN